MLDYYDYYYDYGYKKNPPPLYEILYETFMFYKIILLANIKHAPPSFRNK